MHFTKSLATLGVALVLCSVTMPVLAQESGAPAGTAPATTAPAPTAAERIAAIKANLVQSMQNLKAYQWTETQVVNLKGEDKSNKQFNCSYGPDGKVVKTPVTPKAEEEKKRGIKGKVIENKKEEMSAYMKSAVALIKSYIPPDPAKIQAAKDAGKISMTPLEGGKRVKVDIKDYEKPGDNLGIEVDATTNQISGLSVASYLTDVKDAVTLDVRMGALPDGTGYPSKIVLDGKSQNIKVTVSNADYKKKTS
jgi:hypothetical protein